MTPKQAIRGSSPDDVARFLSEASDDVACAWLCNTAGQRTKAEQVGLARAVVSMDPATVPPSSKALPAAADMLRRVS